MATSITGTITIDDETCSLDGRTLVIDDPDCPPDPDCPAHRAHKFFIDSGTPSGATVTVCGDLDSLDVIHMFRDNSKCQQS